MPRVTATVVQRRYWDRVAAMGCLISGAQAQIAHVAGKPSVVERIKEPKAKGRKLPRMNWLVIPLSPDLHWFMDNRTEEFERVHGPVAALVDRVIATLGVDVWTLSQEGRK